MHSLHNPTGDCEQVSANSYTRLRPSLRGFAGSTRKAAMTPRCINQRDRAWRSAVMEAAMAPGIEHFCGEDSSPADNFPQKQQKQRETRPLVSLRVGYTGPTSGSGSTPLTPTAAGRRRERRSGRRRRLLDPIGQIAVDGADGGLPVDPGERAAAGKISRACHHQTEIGRGGAAVPTRECIAEGIGRRLAPIRTLRGGHRIPADRDDRAVAIP